MSHDDHIDQAGVDAAHDRARTASESVHGYIQQNGAGATDLLSLHLVGDQILTEDCDRSRAVRAARLAIAILAECPEDVLEEVLQAGRS